MRFNVLNIILLIAFFSSCGTPGDHKINGLESKSSSETKRPAVIAFDQEIHNFGTLKEGEIVSFSFKYRNSGGSPLQIVKAEKSCGCISIKYREQPIAPGDSSFIEVVFDTSGEWGNEIKEAIIETSSGERKALQIGAFIENEQFNNLLNTQK